MTITSPQNIVANDLIWKDHIKKEFNASDQWNTKWGFLVSFMSSELESEKCNSKSSRKSSRGQKETVKLPPIKNCGIPDKNSKPFPKTTTQFIGWKAQDSKNSLEKYGRHVKPIKTFLSDMQWPEEAII